MQRSLLAIVLTLAGAAGLTAEPKAQQIVQATQQFHQSATELDLVWWIPNEFWEASLREDSSIPPENRKALLAIVDRYLVFAVLEGKIGITASLSGTPKEELEGKITVHTAAGELRPLAESALTGDARNFFQMMRPILAQMLGQVGQGMHFIVFEGRDAKGVRYADPSGSGFLTVKLGDKEFRWRLPLGCFLPVKYDAGTGEEFPGNYLYSPFTGTRLVATKPDASAKNPDK